MDPVPEPGGHTHQHEPVAKGSTENGGTPSAPVESKTAPGEVNSGGSPSGEGEAGSNGRPDRHQGNPAGGNGDGGKNSAQSPAHASPTSAGDGSSSPLVPILIAIAALGAISVGVVLVRQRRQRPGGGLSAPTG